MRDLRTNLLSVSEFTEKGHAEVFVEGYKIYGADSFEANGEIVVTGSNRNGLYELHLELLHTELCGPQS